ncbi:Os01g0812600 [Oryza sativa Japonica Group]|uniref:Os01g0812600 protein n=2 Tax=Oryza sativa subsp. japonica TaxID=39947 RepID=A0A0P0V9P3_ORYSJ|nr:uncharacterized protein LOC9271886 [Oryza sativa Japonica Group]KAF2952923.1 hypothetical protein DAI22_01g373700 [Oryza sativa Japonica Group]BAH91347.1 Os01g0812600 [Oryza sativa Japonica Group]BAS74885.1 Os01g0812600 [Oryza sativa Japonica Group]|eukprot:NP_001172617.1 Os01g0812600 [Oryza sativa Japonica Group]
MGTVSSSSRRRAAGSQPSSSSWVKALDVENDEEAAARADADADAHALEAKGDKLMSQARRELHGVWSYVSRPFIVAARARFYFHKAAETFVLANSWRKAAAAHHEHAVCCMKIGRSGRLRAAFALFEAGKCYMKVLEPDDEEMTSRTVSDLEKSLRMFVLENELVMAAEVCVELANLYAMLKQWEKVREYRQKAAEFHAKTSDALFDTSTV